MSKILFSYKITDFGIKERSTQTNMLHEVTVVSCDSKVGGLSLLTAKKLNAIYENNSATLSWDYMRYFWPVTVNL